jgi:hypothetical protein
MIETCIGKGLLIQESFRWEVDHRCLSCLATVRSVIFR